MIELSEIRTGNLIRSHAGIITVAGINYAPERIKKPPYFVYGIIDDKDYAFELEDLHGIEINAIELVKLGFEKQSDTVFDHHYLSPLHLSLMYKGSGYAMMFMGSMHVNRIYPCHFVHQLQNLYFTLTGRELKL